MKTDKTLRCAGVWAECWTRISKHQAEKSYNLEAFQLCPKCLEEKLAYEEQKQNNSLISTM